MFKLFTSVKLTLALLLLLAVVSIGGTIVPVEAQRYELYYQNFAFRILLGLLALNLICCTLKSFPQKRNYRRQLQQSLVTKQQGELLRVESLAVAEKQLSTAGFRIEAEGERLVAERGSIGRWGSTVVHLAILLIMLGAILAETGFVGTINTYLQQPNHLYFDWDAQQDRELGFQFRADSFRLRYYPIELRFDLVDAATGTGLGQLIMKDNGHFEVPGSVLSGQLRGFDPEARLLTIDVLKRGKVIGQYLVGEKFEQFGAEQHPGFRLNNIAFRDPVLKQMEAEVSVLEDGRVVKQGTIRVNEPLTFRGISFYQTAYGQDEAGRRSVGFQLSKDPGEGLVWAATLLLMLGFVLAFFLPRRAVGIKQAAGQLQLYPLYGWRGESGSEKLADLLKLLNS